jgi:hypothetical protein
MIFGNFDGTRTPESQEPDMTVEKPPSPQEIIDFSAWLKRQKDNEEKYKAVPSFVMSDIDQLQYELLAEILEQHRCRNCRTFLCCGSGIFHTNDCWTHGLQDQITLGMIRSIYTYRIDVITGCMKGWEEYCYSTFNPETHLKPVFGAHNYGFFVRCFGCKRCHETDKKYCHAKHHDHNHMFTF